MPGSPPPFLAAMMIARLSLLHNLPRLASIAPFLCLMVAQWEWPDMIHSPRRAAGSAGIDGRADRGSLTSNQFQFACDLVMPIVHCTPIFLFIQGQRFFPGLPSVLLA